MSFDKAHTYIRHKWIKELLIKFSIMCVVLCTIVSLSAFIDFKFNAEMPTTAQAEPLIESNDGKDSVEVAEVPLIMEEVKQTSIQQSSSSKLAEKENTSTTAHNQALLELDKEDLQKIAHEKKSDSKDEASQTSVSDNNKPVISSKIAALIQATSPTQVDFSKDYVVIG